MNLDQNTPNNGFKSIVKSKMSVIIENGTELFQFLSHVLQKRKTEVISHFRLMAEDMGLERGHD